MFLHAFFAKNPEILPNVVFDCAGKTLCGQVLDVNMVNEPKEHVVKLKGQKRKEKETPGAGQQQVLSYYVTSLGAIIQVDLALQGF
jgi:hypothetical protein